MKETEVESKGERGGEYMPLDVFAKRYLNGEGFITNVCVALFAVTALYETTTHTDSYRQVAFYKLASIKFFD